MEASYRYRVTNVIHIVDGDTVDLSIDLGFYTIITERFRLLDINAPEMVGATRAAGQISKDWLAQKLTIPLPIHVETQKADSFRRWLANIYVGSECINDTMLQLGLAVPFKKS